MYFPPFLPLGQDVRWKGRLLAQAGASIERIEHCVITHNLLLQMADMQE
jgi:hypothetical protein